ncbi:MAG: hypothetical protein RLZZ511_329 [Cyanobacteriota bacterium]|jgi:uncharacterized protein (TIGR00730 family)
MADAGDRRILPTPEPTYESVHRAIVQLWDVINQLNQIPGPQCDRYRVSIFGSARLSADDPLYSDVRHLAQALTAMGCDIVTGGGPGLMQAANEGSVLADPDDLTQSIGLRIALDFEQGTNPFVEKLYNHETFFSRLNQFILLSQAFVVVPGGIGTTLEMMMVWQLIQVGKLPNVPLILVGDMWQELVNWATRTMVDQPSTPLAKREDMQIPIVVPNIEAAIAHLQTAKAQWRDHCDLL